MMRWVAFPVLASLALLGCGDPQNDPTAAATSGVSVDNSGCAERSPQRCAQDARCSVIEGTRFDLTHECRAEIKPLGCRDKRRECPDNVRTTLVDDKKQTWVVPGDVDQPACLPRDFALETVQGGPRVEDWQSCTSTLAPPCAELPVDRCTHPRCITVKATRVDVAQACSKGSEAVACMRTGMLCDDAASLAKDALGNSWQLPSSCLPNGWSTLSIRLNGMTWSSLPSGWEKPCP
jgi:hypothetical protein